MISFNPPASLLADFYKVSHRVQYPKGTEKVYSTWTPRASRIKEIDKVVFFGIQSFIKEYLIDYFNENFFKRKVDDVIAEYVRVIKFALQEPNPDASHIKALHNLGYLPIEINAVPEGTQVPIRVPMYTVENTLPEFFWLTNYLETLMSCEMWSPMTSATIASYYRKRLDDYARKTNSDMIGFVPWQGHDFSMRGMSSLNTAAKSGAGHLLSFYGTDTIPAILYLEQYYNANIENELVGGSVPATEHSVMCAGGKEDEYETFRRIVTELYPKGIVSIVSDTWDLWNVLTKTIPSLKNEILARDGKVVIRPDSGDPVDIICGRDLKSFPQAINEQELIKYAEDYLDDKLVTTTPHGEYGGDIEEDIIWNNQIYTICYSPDWNRYDKQYYYIDNYGDNHTTIKSKRDIKSSDKGVIESLWDVFGGTITKEGYKQLDSHIGCIYGDAITIERCIQICERLANKGFASTNMVYGVGSFTYQYNTRDTFGFALKSTYVVIDGKEINIFKDPVTDNGIKKSQTGKVVVYYNDKGELTYRDGLNEYDYKNDVTNILKPIFKDGKLLIETSLKEIREKLK